MLFRRRAAPGISERIRVWLWPRRSWSRSLRYVVLRLLRLKADPHALALGSAAGVFAACTPLIGGQFVLAAVLAFALRASVPAAVLATFFGNPLSWPLIWPATYIAGAHMIGGGVAGGLGDVAVYAKLVGQAMAARSPELLAEAGGIVWPVVKPMLVGSLPVGLAAGVLIYYMMRSAVRAFEQRRRHVLGVAGAMAAGPSELSTA